ncbi:transposase [Rhizobium grahamii]|uniref:Putative transcriptional regulator syrB2 n=1 Tax=Rhizobium grahamii CCGE 502 TaxID=990285 RepID=S3HJP2_9HYPH|nr:transposase [Rhizobium grahamii]EPE93756.1 putative transcriptional regulator syrB2 [Rhizobium grahamii CCGE 502]
MIGDNDMEAALIVPEVENTGSPFRTRLRRYGVRERLPFRLDRSKAAAAGNSRRYTEQERREKIAFIEAAVAAGPGTRKQAIHDAGISEQTYYQWKRSTQSTFKTAAQSVPIADAADDLVQLEAENQRLRKLLAEKLREENAELRKRLGLIKTNRSRSAGPSVLA